MKIIYLAGGCFWGTEKYLGLIPGVIETTVGYANGHTKNPTYEDVCHHDTGHAESVKVVYDEQRLSLKMLLRMFFEVIDPTSLNRQGGDVGIQYRTGIYYTEPTDLPVIMDAMNAVQTRHKEKLATEVLPLVNFYDAEEYHQDYLEKNPTGYCHIGKAEFDKARLLKPNELL